MLDERGWQLHHRIVAGEGRRGEEGRGDVEGRGLEVGGRRGRLAEEGAVGAVLLLGLLLLGRRGVVGWAEFFSFTALLLLLPLLCLYSENNNLLVILYNHEIMIICKSKIQF